MERAATQGIVPEKVAAPQIGWEVLESLHRPPTAFFKLWPFMKVSTSRTAFCDLEV